MIGVGIANPTPTSEPDMRPFDMLRAGFCSRIPLPRQQSANRPLRLFHKLSSTQRQVNSGDWIYSWAVDKGEKMSSFCPIIKDECKESKCIAWKDDECLIFSFLESSTQYSTVSIGNEIDDGDNFGYRGNQPQKIPTEMVSATAEQLANELVEFSKKEFEGEKSIWISQTARYFWEKKGVNRYGVSGEVSLKLEKAERLAQQLLSDEREAEKQRRLESEKTQIPQLVDQCVRWATKHRITRLTIADVDAFLLEQNSELLTPTKRAIYATANVNLKSRKW
jgi:hypothetical protein